MWLTPKAVIGGYCISILTPRQGFLLLPAVVKTPRPRFALDFYLTDQIGRIYSLWKLRLGLNLNDLKALPGA